MAPRSDTRPLADTTNQHQNLSSAPTKRRRLSVSSNKAQLPLSGSKSAPTITLSRENVIVSPSSDCITTTHHSALLCEYDSPTLFQFPSSSPSPSPPVPFPSLTLPTMEVHRDEPEPESAAASPKRRRTSRSVSSYTTATIDASKRRRATKHRRSASVTHHSLLSPAASAPMLVMSPTSTTIRRLPSAEVRFAAMVRRTVLNGIHVDVPMIDLSVLDDKPSAIDEARSHYTEIQEQNAVLAARLERMLADKGFQQPPPDVEATTGPLSVIPPAPTPTPEQLVALLIMRLHERPAVRATRSYALKDSLRASSPLCASL